MPKMTDPSKFIEYFKEAIENVSFNDDPPHLRSYSGKGMYGDRCLGMVGAMRDCQKVISQMLIDIVDKVYEAGYEDGSANEEVEAGAEAQKTYENASDIVKRIFGYETDGMGRDSVVIYWKDIPFTSDDEHALEDKCGCPVEFEKEEEDS